MEEIEFYISESAFYKILNIINDTNSLFFNEISKKAQDCHEDSLSDNFIIGNGNVEDDWVEPNIEDINFGFDKESLSVDSYIEKNEKNESNYKKYFKISVGGGGCAGFSYSFDLVNKKKYDDIELCIKSGEEEVNVLIDGMGIDLLSGSYLDYQASMMNSKFVITNPNACSSCSCGSSFGV